MGQGFGVVPSWGRTVTIRWHNVYTNAGPVTAFATLFAYMLGRYAFCAGSIWARTMIY
jgi:hypothetical protein